MKKVTAKTKSEIKNPEFERTKNAFRQILSVPKEKIDQIEKRRSTKPPQKSEKDCN
jgi:hypothetical protein